MFVCLFVPWNKHYVVYFIVQSAFLSPIKVWKCIDFILSTVLHILTLLRIYEGVPSFHSLCGHYQFHLKGDDLLFLWPLSISQRVFITLVQQIIFSNYYLKASENLMVNTFLPKFCSIIISVIILRAIWCTNSVVRSDEGGDDDALMYHLPLMNDRQTM